MEHQDWNNVVFSDNNKKNNTSSDKPKYTEEEIKYSSSKFGQTLLKSRTEANKTQKQLAQEMGIAVQFITRWESNKELPNNKQISIMEKILNIKLPRLKKIIIEKD